MYYCDLQLMCGVRSFFEAWKVSTITGSGRYFAETISKVPSLKGLVGYLHSNYFSFFFLRFLLLQFFNKFFHKSFFESWLHSNSCRMLLSVSSVYVRECSFDKDVKHL